MLTYTIRRLVLAVPTLIFISLVIFLLLELAPGDPMSKVPLTVPDLHPIMTTGHLCPQGNTHNTGRNTDAAAGID